ncbi:MAG: TlpA disulfide reductase family protein [Acidobacteriaceae bacterium]
MRRSRFILPGATALALLLSSGCDRGDHPNNLSRPAPLFTIGDGVQTLDLARLRGRVVVLNLWATWCAPCVQELPSLLDLQRSQPQLAVVGISTDQDDAVYRSFLRQHHVDLVTVRDGDQRINALYGTVQIPETYIIDRNGILRRKFIGAQVWTSPEIVGYLKSL